MKKKITVLLGLGIMFVVAGLASAAGEELTGRGSRVAADQMLESDRLQDAQSLDGDAFSPRIRVQKPFRAQEEEVEDIFGANTTEPRRSQRSESTKDVDDDAFTPLWMENERVPPSVREQSKGRMPAQRRAPLALDEGMMLQPDRSEQFLRDVQSDGGTQERDRGAMSRGIDAGLDNSEQINGLDRFRAPLPDLAKQPLLEQREDRNDTVGRKAGRKTIAPSIPSRLEKMIGADELLAQSRTKPVNPTKKIQQFGYTFFKESPFSAAQDLPVSADYMLAPGDTLVITVWGAVNGTYEIPISRSGELSIPKVGPVKLAGLPFGSVREVLKTRLATIYRNFDLSVSMGRLRTIKVYVVGEVTSPGDYAVSGLATVINALGAAGGPTKNGSLRNIKVRRAAGGEDLVDLYEFFTAGDKSRDMRLQSGDTIFVPVIGKVAAIAGNVKRPAIYELKNEQTLKDLLTLAEGVTATGNLQQVQIARTVANAGKSVIDLNLDPQKSGKSLDELAADVKINDLDVVRVYGISGLLRGHVKLSGHLERQGFFAVSPGQRISSVLYADQLLPEYHPEVLEITRLVPPDLHREKLLVNLTAALAKDPKNDIELKEFDTLRVFSRWDLEERLTVRVSGEVQQPGSYRHNTGMTVRDLLVQAGNTKASAYLKSAEISRLSLRNERAQMEPITINLDEAIKGNPAHNLVLAPFDEINVRRIPNWANEKDRYVKLSGEFVFPGTYPIYKGERLSSVIARAGGFSDKAYLPGTKFTREIVRKLQQQRLNESLEKAQEEVVRKQSSIMSVASSKEELEATKATLDALEKSILLLKAKRAEGRVLISLNSLASLKGSVYDVEVEGGDNLSVPSDPASVNVLGSVYNPTTALYEPAKSVSHYLEMVGGVTKDGEASDMYLVKADGTVISRQQASSFLFFDTFGFKTVESGDTIVVPQKIERTAWLRDIKDITTILSQVAISAGTVFLGLR